MLPFLAVSGEFQVAAFHESDCEGDVGHGGEAVIGKHGAGGVGGSPKAVEQKWGLFDALF